jgi:hypothetical protein
MEGHHQVYLRADWEFLSDWHFNSQINGIIDRDRVVGDNRPDIDDYSLVDFTVRRKNIKDTGKSPLLCGTCLILARENLAQRIRY